jgi:hypothetical protein
MLKYSEVLGYYVGNRKSIPNLCAHKLPPPAIRLLVGLVATNRLGRVKVRVNAGVELVQHVTVVRSSSCVGVSAANSAVWGAVATSETSSSGTVCVVAAGEA